MQAAVDPNSTWSVVDQIEDRELKRTIATICCRWWILRSEVERVIFKKDSGEHPSQDLENVRFSEKLVALILTLEEHACSTFDRQYPVDLLSISRVLYVSAIPFR
jgi:hypothetical protein